MSNPELGMSPEEYYAETQEKAHDAGAVLSGLESLKRYNELAENRDKARGNKTLLAARRGIVVGDLHRALAGAEDNFRDTVLGELPKEVRNTYESLYRQEPKPERKGLFSRMKEKVGGWVKEKAAPWLKEEFIEKPLRKQAFAEEMRNRGEVLEVSNKIQNLVEKGFLKPEGFAKWVMSLEQEKAPKPQ